MTAEASPDLLSDLRRIFIIQALRAFGYGFASVLVGTVLASAGLSDFQVGAVFTAMLAGMALASVAVGRYGEAVGRRRLYGSLLALMGVAGAVFAVTQWLPALLLAALSGTLSPDPNESGPITSLEQAMIGGVQAGGRARAFGRYNAVAYASGSFGALAAAGPALARKAVPGLPSNQWWLLVFPILGLACRVLAGRLTGAVEVAVATPGRRASLVRSKSTVRRLGALFALDSFGGGFITQAFLVFWFRRRFGASPDVMGAVFFAAGGLQAASSILAGRIASRIGLLNTMVLTHLPSNIALLAIPLAPALPWAIAILLVRFALSQMDVPTRQAYLVAMVDPEERVGAAAYTNTARYLTRPPGPAVAGALMGSIGVGSPFLAAGGLKIVYDVAIYLLFRNVPDAERAAGPPDATGGAPSGST